MAAEQEHGASEEGQKHPWNRSTRLLHHEQAAMSRARARPAENAPRRARPARSTPANRPVENKNPKKSLRNDTALPNEEDQDQRALTRELLERAVSTAFGGLLQDSTLDTAAFPDVHESQSSKQSSVRNKENSPPPGVMAASLELKLRTTLEASASLSTNHRQRRRQHAEAQEKATVATDAAREFQRRMKHATFEHRQRKLAVQALQARIQREIQFLTATAADLEKREFLLDDAFENYESALRLELGVADDKSLLSDRGQVGDPSDCF